MDTVLIKVSAPLLLDIPVEVPDLTVLLIKVGL